MARTYQKSLVSECLSTYSIYRPVNREEFFLFFKGRIQYKNNWTGILTFSIKKYCILLNIPFDIALQEIMLSCIEEKLPHLDTAMKIFINLQKTIFNEAKITS